MDFFVRNHQTQGDRYYVCPQCGATFTTQQDRGDINLPGPPANPWQPHRHYMPGNRVMHGGNVYTCILEHTSQPDHQPPDANLWTEETGTHDPYPEDLGNGVCPYHGDHTDPAAGFPSYFAPGERVGLVLVQAEGRKVETQLVRSLTVPEAAAGNPWLPTFPTLRPQIPDSSVRITLDAPFVSLGTDHADYLGTRQAVAVKVPKHQTASEPGDGPGNSNNYEANWGYRGMALTYQPTDALVTLQPTIPWATATAYVVGDAVVEGGAYYRCMLNHTSDATNQPGSGLAWPTFWVEIPKWFLMATPTPYDDNEQWDAYYVCPDCGEPYSGPAPPAVGGNVMHCNNPGCPGHEWCPMCGCVYPAGTVTCPFDGTNLNVVDPVTAGDDNFGIENVAAEEFDAYDIQVTVPKRTTLVATAQTADLGRTAPGVGVTPDMTVRSAGGTPAGRVPEPMGTSHEGAFKVRNEGNTIPNLVGVTPNAGLGSGVDDAWYRLFRPDADQNDWQDPTGKRGHGWTAARNPVSRDLKDTGYEHLAAGWLPVGPDGPHHNGGHRADPRDL